MAVLITGAGMVGSQIARILVERGETPVLFELAPHVDNISRIVDLAKVKIVRGDVLEPAELTKVIKEEKIDRIIHTVTLFGMTAGMVERLYAGIKVNIMGLVNVLELATVLGLKRVVYTSSNTVYMRPHLDMTGANLPEDFPVWTVSGRSPLSYATTKLIGEQLGFTYYDTHGLDFVTIRFAGVFGPWKPPISGVTGRMVESMLSSALAGNPIIVGEGWSPSFKSDVVYSKDAARAAVLACFAETPQNRVYNISMGQLYDQTQIVELVKGLIPGTRAEIRPTTHPRPPANPMINLPMDISKASSELGYEPEHNMEAALKDYIQWMKAN